MNKKIVFAAIIVFLGLVILNKKPKMIFDAMLAKYGKDKRDKFAKVYEVVSTLPIAKDTLKMVLAQILTETGVFSNSSNVFNLNNNASGILYSGSKGQIANGATRGSKRMSVEGGYYAKFDTLQNWAKEYYRVLNKGALPLKAHNINDFAIRLKQNDYFKAPLSEYKKNLIFFHNYLTKYGI